MVLPVEEKNFINENIDSFSVLKDINEDIVSLNLHGNFLQSLNDIPKLPKLEILNVSCNRIKDSDFPELIQLSRLIYLDLSGNMIESIEFLPFLPNIQHFYISFNYISNLNGISNFPNIKTLDLRGNNLTTLSDVKYLDSLPSLSELQITSDEGRQSNPICKFISDIKHIFSFCPNLILIDNKNLTQWETICASILTPKFDSIAKRFWKRATQEVSQFNDSIHDPNEYLDEINQEKDVYEDIHSSTNNNDNNNNNNRNNVNNNRNNNNNNDNNINNNNNNNSIGDMISVINNKHTQTTHDKMNVFDTQTIINISVPSTIVSLYDNILVRENELNGLMNDVCQNILEDVIISLLYEINSIEWDTYVSNNESSKSNSTRTEKLILSEDTLANEKSNIESNLKLIKLKSIIHKKNQFQKRFVFIHYRRIIHLSLKVALQDLSDIQKELNEYRISNKLELSMKDRQLQSERKRIEMIQHNYVTERIQFLAELKNGSNTINELTININQLKNELERKTNSFLEEKNKYELLYSQFVEYKSASVSTTNALEDLKSVYDAEVNSLRMNLQRSEATIHDMTEKLRSSTSTIESQLQKLDSYHHMETDLKNQIENMRLDMNSKALHACQLNEKLTSTQLQLKEETDRNSYLERQVQQLHHQLESVTHTASQLNSQLMLLTNKNIMQAQAMKEQQSLIVELTHQRKAMKADIERLRKSTEFVNISVDASSDTIGGTQQTSTSADRRASHKTPPRSSTSAPRHTPEAKAGNEEGWKAALESERNRSAMAVTQAEKYLQKVQQLETVQRDISLSLRIKEKELNDRNQLILQLQEQMKALNQKIRKKDSEIESLKSDVSHSR